MALPDRDGDLLVLLLLMLVAERSGADREEVEPILDDMLRRLEQDFDRDERFSRFPFPSGYFFHILRRSLAGGGPLGRRTRVTDLTEQIYGRISERLDLMASDLDRRFSELDDELEEIDGRLDGMSDEHRLHAEETSKSVDRVSDALKTLEWALSVGVQASEAKLERSIPVRIYLSEKTSSDTNTKIVDSIVAVLESLAFEKDVELPEESGSWWKRLWMRSKDLVTQEEIQDRLIKIERIAEAKLLEKPQAEANKDHAAAVATIMKSLDNVGSACVQIGNILLVKHTSNTGSVRASARVMVRTLNAIEMRALERNQTLLKDPARIIQKLEHMCAVPPDSGPSIQLPPAGS